MTTDSIQVYSIQKWEPLPLCILYGGTTLHWSVTGESTVVQSSQSRGDLRRRVDYFRGSTGSRERDTEVEFGKLSLLVVKVNFSRTRDLHGLGRNPTPLHVPSDPRLLSGSGSP